MDENKNQPTDHDLLLIVHEQVKGLREDVKDLKDNTTVRLQKVEENKADQSALDILAIDVKWLQRIAYIGLGVLAAIQFYFNSVKK